MWLLTILNQVLITLLAKSHDPPCRTVVEVLIEKTLTATLSKHLITDLVELRDPRALEVETLPV